MDKKSNALHTCPPPVGLLHKATLQNTVTVILNLCNGESLYNLLNTGTGELGAL
jgi:hypothetical protein